MGSHESSPSTLQLSLAKAGSLYPQDVPEQNSSGYQGTHTLGLLLGQNHLLGTCRSASLCLGFCTWHLRRTFGESPRARSVFGEVLVPRSTPFLGGLLGVLMGTFTNKHTFCKGDVEGGHTQDSVFLGEVPALCLVQLL